MVAAGVKPGKKHQALVALGVVSAVFIPLVLEGLWAAPILALEGAAFFWIGLWQRRILTRHLGLLLQFIGGFIFIDSVWYPFSAVPFANYYFFACLCLALAALSASYLLDRYAGLIKLWERYYPMPLMILGLIWWYVGGLREADRHISRPEIVHGMLMFCCASAILAGMGIKKLDWPRLTGSMCLLLPAMALLAVVKMTRSVADNLFFIGWGAVTWTVAFYIQCRILSLYAGSWSRTTMFVWYLGTILLFLYILGHEGAWMIGGNSMPVKWQFWTVLVVWGGLLTVIVRNLIREMTSPGEKRVSVKR